MSEPRLLDRVRAVARLRHLSLSTEQTYADWIRRFILFHGKRHPSGMGSEQIRQFLTHSAVSRRVSASTQSQALCALLFLYRDVLQVDLPYVDGIERAKRPVRVPVVFTREEVGRLLSHLSGTCSLIASLLYGSGLRLMEALRLRVKDLDFKYGQITVRAGKGEKDRRTVMPGPLVGPLRDHLNEGAQAVLSSMPCAPGVSVTNKIFGGITPGQVTVAFRRVCKGLGIVDFSFHDLRHTAASWLRMSGADTHTVAQLLGHKDLRMAARYLHLSPAFLAEAVNKLDGVFGELRYQDVTAPKALIAEASVSA